MPEPGAYKPQSDFEPGRKGAKMFSFGSSREAYDRVYYPERIPHDRAIPGPGQYDQQAKTITKSDANSFSMLGRIPSLCKFSKPPPLHFLTEFSRGSSCRREIKDAGAWHLWRAEQER